MRFTLCPAPPSFPSARARSPLLPLLPPFPLPHPPPPSPHPPSRREAGARCPPFGGLLRTPSPSPPPRVVVPGTLLLALPRPRVCFAYPAATRVPRGVRVGRWSWAPRREEEEEDQRQHQVPRPLTLKWPLAVNSTSELPPAAPGPISCSCREDGVCPPPCLCPHRCQRGRTESFKITPPQLMGDWMDRARAEARGNTGDCLVSLKQCCN